MTPRELRYVVRNKLILKGDETNPIMILMNVKGATIRQGRKNDKECGAKVKVSTRYKWQELYDKNRASCMPPHGSCQIAHINRNIRELIKT